MKSKTYCYLLHFLFKSLAFIFDISNTAPTLSSICFYYITRDRYITLRSGATSYFRLCLHYLQVIFIDVATPINPFGIECEL